MSETIKILENRALRGPNRYSRYPAIFLLLDIGGLEDRPSDTIPGYPERLVGLLPSLHGHRCSVGEPGGFIQRLQRGTWAGHVVEHVAIELQCLAGMEVGFGKTYDTPDRGLYEVVFRYRVEKAGLFAGRQAVALVAAAIAGEPFDLEAVIQQLKEMREEDMLGPSTASIVDEAKRRGIPTMRLNDASLVQLGYGVRQRRIQATMSDRTSALGVEIADEKFVTKRLLRQAGIPAPRGEIVTSLQDCLEAAAAIGYPVAVKPDVGNHGRGITARVANAAELEAAYAPAREICRRVVVEKSLSGHDFRVLLINNKMVAAARREPAHVIGDGQASIQTLIDRVNADPRRGFGHEKVLTRIDVDEMTEHLLRLRGLGLADVLAEGEKFQLKSTANLSTGGTSCDVTDQVHPDVKFMCERIARIIGLDCMGIDIIATGLDQPLDGESAGVVEVNAAPGFRMHLEPAEGLARDVARPFVDMLFPREVDFAVPIVAVTGTNGKTTTSRLIAHTLKYAGQIVGFAGTTGIEIDGNAIVAGDYSGPEGVGIVLREPSIDHAVLEVARGGIIRRGLGFDACDVAVFLNVEHDHIGVDGVSDLETLGRIKSTVIEVVKPGGVAVLNADDPTVVSLGERTRGQVIYFSLQPDNPVVVAHVQAGGLAVIQLGREVVLRSRTADLHILSVFNAPITLQGIVSFNIANVLAAVAALKGLGLPVEAIRKGISSFHPSVSQNPGRMNLIDFLSFKVLVDYAHNSPAVRALGAALPHLSTGRKLVLAHGTGNRPDADLEDFGATLAEVYQHIILADVDPRGREPGATSWLVRNGALRQGLSETAIEVIDDPIQALDAAFARVGPGDLLVVQVDAIEPMLERIMQHFEAAMKQ
ncbi:MAG TPA: cyanophycin synthetase [Candidatus Obscuribacterales bacterium]